MMKSRREFLVAALLTGLSARAAERVQDSRKRVAALLEGYRKDSPTTRVPYQGERPNILLITTDQQWAGAMGCAENPYLTTPAMDEIARTGVRFDAAYTPNPICVPARTSYMTGTPSHENGVVANVREEQVDLSQPCLARRMREHGYATGYVGKWHIPRSIHDADWSGFDYREATRSNKVDFDIPEHCARFLLEPREKPFFLVTSFVNPHDICEWARRLNGMEQTLPNGGIGTPPPPELCPPFRTNRAIPPGEPAVIREHQADPNMARAYPTRAWDADDGRWRQYLWGYYRMVELVDQYIGQVLEVLRASGQWDNTVVIFTSDHGDGMGSHRWNQKTLFYDEVARVPFLVSWPGHTRAGHRDSLVNIGTDLFPTIFEFAGIESPHGLSGRSVASIALGEVDKSPPPYILSENNHHSGFGNPTRVQGRMLRSARYKYIRYNEGAPREQLFDMVADPEELKDLSLDESAAALLQQHRDWLDEYITRTNDSFPPWSKA